MERIPSLAEALDAFLIDLTLEGRSPATVHTYRALLKPMADDRPISALNPSVCRLLIADRLKRQSRSTARTFSGALCSFTAYLALMHSVPDAMKDVPIPHVPIPPHSYLSRDELSALWKACPDESYQLMFLLLVSGLRAGEICALGAVSGDVVQIRGKGGKHRRIALPAPAIAILERIGTPAYSTERLRVRVRNLAKLAGLKRRVHPHMFRHSFASHALMEGMDTETLRMLGGWSDSSKMVAHYTRSVREEAAIKRSREFGLTEKLLDTASG